MRSTHNGNEGGHMPFQSYQESHDMSIMHAGSHLNETGCKEHELEDDVRHEGKIKAIADVAITVLEHMGMKRLRCGSS